MEVTLSGRGARIWITALEKSDARLKHCRLPRALPITSQFAMLGARAAEYGNDHLNRHLRRSRANAHSVCNKFINLSTVILSAPGCHPMYLYRRGYPNESYPHPSPLSPTSLRQFPSYTIPPRLLIFNSPWLRSHKTSELSSSALASVVSPQPSTSGANSASRTSQSVVFTLGNLTTYLQTLPDHREGR